MDRDYDVIYGQMTVFDFLVQEDKQTNTQEDELSETNQDE